MQHVLTAELAATFSSIFQANFIMIGIYGIYNPFIPEEDSS